MSDIDRIRDKKENGPGVCFIDGSENGDTMYKVLGYCEKVGFKRVLVIDPFSRFSFNKVTPINPIHTEASLITDSVNNLSEVFQYVFSVNDPAKTAYIENYLPAFFKILATAGLTLNDLQYFTDFEQYNWRDKIYEMSDDDPSVRKLKLPYKNLPLFTKEVGSTMRRIDTAFRDEGLRLILSHRKGINFVNLIKERWLILVNPSRLNKLPGRLLSALVINEVIFGLNRLIGSGWRGYEYLYIDEAARYATSQITDVLDYLRKIGLRLVLSHQDLGQFGDNDLAKAIKGRAKTKIAFYIADNEERMKVVKMMYGGELSDRDVSYALSQQQKQNAVVKLGKEAAKIIKIHDTPTYTASKEYIQSLYDNPWYYTHQEITQDQNERFRRTDTPSSKAATKSSSKPVSDANGEPQEHGTKAAAKAGKPGSDNVKRTTGTGTKWDDVVASIKRGKDKGAK
jgi:hypothetical protein